MIFFGAFRGIEVLDDVTKVGSTGQGFQARVSAATQLLTVAQLIDANYLLVQDDFRFRDGKVTNVSIRSGILSVVEYSRRINSTRPSTTKQSLKRGKSHT